MRRAFLGLVLFIAGCSSREDIVGTGCENCHRPANLAVGIEEQHPLFAIRCVECHGGDPAARSVEAAHVAEMTPGAKDLRDRSAAELAATDPSYRRFINPGDLVAAAQTCGSAGPQGAQGCHQSIVDASSVSTHATNVGVASQPRYAAGLSSERAEFGVAGVTDADFQPAGAPEGTIGSVEAITLPALPMVITASDAPALWAYAIGKNCSGCHIGLYGSKGQGRPNDTFAGGCSACHMYYADDGVSQSADPARDTSGGVHPVKHMIERTVPEKQCLRCHSRSLRVGQAWRGWRERTLLEDERDLANAKLVEGALHGRPEGYFIEDEDTRDAIDYTPPDIHQERGMTCIDCHLARDLHGDGSMKDSAPREVGIECEDCHGTFTATAGASGEFLTSAGVPLARLRLENGRILLKGALDGVDRVVTQLVNLRTSLALERAHSSDNHGSLECYACHTSWMQNVYSLRRTIDFRGMSENPLDGMIQPGVVADFDEIQVRGPLGNAGMDPNAFTGFHLGMNADGKISPLMVENARLDVIVQCNPANEPAGTCTNTLEQPIFGKKIIDGWFPHARDGKRGFEWRPLNPHATSTRANVQPCQQCHPRQFEVSEVRVRATYGFGANRFTATDPMTRMSIDLTQMIDAAGNPVLAFPAPDSGPLPMTIIERALSYKIEPPL